MNDPTIKKYRAKGRRTLADGTVKEYTCNKTYKVKNGVNDLRKVNSGRTEKLTPAQKEEIWARYQNGVTIKRICADIGVSYIPVKKCIDKKKALLPAVKPPIVPPAIIRVPSEQPAIIPAPGEQPGQQVITDDDMAAFDALLALPK